MRELVVAHYNEDLAWIHSTGNRAIIYSKGELPVREGIILPNVGREAHTFASHVSERYDDLPEITIFAQGNPFDHCRDFMQKIEEPCEWFSWLAHDRWENDINGEPNLLRPMGAWHEEVIEQPFPGRVLFGAGGMFMATRDCLRSVPLAKWRQILRLATTDTYFPWMMERTWQALLCRTPRFE